MDHAVVPPVSYEQNPLHSDCVELEVFKSGPFQSLDITADPAPKNLYETCAGSIGESEIKNPTCDLQNDSISSDFKVQKVMLEVYQSIGLDYEKVDDERSAFMRKWHDFHIHDATASNSDAENDSGHLENDLLQNEGSDKSDITSLSSYYEDDVLSWGSYEKFEGDVPEGALICKSHNNPDNDEQSGQISSKQESPSDAVGCKLELRIANLLHKQESYQNKLDSAGADFHQLYRRYEESVDMMSLLEESVDKIQLQMLEFCQETTGDEADLFGWATFEANFNF